MGKLRNVLKQNKISFGVALAVVAIVLGGFFAFNFINKDVLAVVGSTKITRKDLNERIYGQEFRGSIDNPPEISKAGKEELLTDMIEKEIARQKAEKDNITVSGEEIDAYIAEKATNFKDYTDEQKTLTKKSVKASLLLEKVKERVLGWSEGSYVLVRFDKNFDSDMAATPAQKALEDVDRDKRIEEDRKYAETLVNSIYNDISSGALTFEQGMGKAKNDPVLGVEAYKPMTGLQSGTYTKEDYKNNENIFSIVEAKEKIKMVKEGEISKPFAVKINAFADPRKEEQKEGLWLIVKVSSAKAGESNTYFDWLESEKTRLKVKVYKKNIASIVFPVLGMKAYADSGAHSCGDSDHWGVKTQNLMSTAGLVVETKYRNTDLSEGYTNMNVNINSQQVGGGGGILYTPNGASQSYSSGSSNRDFTTGSTFYKDGVGSAGCAYVGRLVLGYGSTSGSGLNGHFGNGYTLGCAANTFTVSATDDGPGAYGGTWTGGESWNGAAKNINVTNGSTAWQTFIWVKKAAPPSGNKIPKAVSIAPVDGRQFVDGVSDTIAADKPDCIRTFTPARDGVYMCSKGVDDEGDQVQIRVQYRTVGSSVWSTAYSNSNGKIDWTAATNSGVERRFKTTMGDGVTSKVNAGYTYEWRTLVRAVTGSGTSCGLDSNGNPTLPCGVSPVRKFTIQAPKPATPTGSISCQSTTAQGTNSIKIASLGNALENTGYVYRKTGDTLTYKGGGRVGTVVSDTGLSASTSYNYQLYAKDSSGYWHDLGGTSCATNPPPPSISCDRLGADPLGGTLPLTVKFTAYVTPSNITNPSYTYDWIFGDGQTKTNGTNPINHTYTKNEEVTPKVTVTETNTSKACEKTVTFTINPWSGGDQNEVAP